MDTIIITDMVTGQLWTAVVVARIVARMVARVVARVVAQVLGGAMVVLFFWNIWWALSCTLCNRGRLRQ